MIGACWAIIPARGGSTGIKKKNIQLLGGKPLIAHAITALQDAGVYEKIVVTSDSEEILRVAEAYDAEVYLRSDPNESDNVVMPDVPVLSYLESVPKHLRPKFSLMVQCTAPFITPDTYRKALHELRGKENATVFAAHNAHTFLWKKECETKSDSKWLPINHPFHERVGRQFSKVQQVNETGAFYGFAVESFLAARHRFFSEAYPVLLSGDEVVDINDMNDLEYAQFIILRREA